MNPYIRAYNVLAETCNACSSENIISCENRECETYWNSRHWDFANEHRFYTYQLHLALGIIPAEELVKTRRKPVGRKRKVKDKQSDEEFFQAWLRSRQPRNDSVQIAEFA